MKLEALSLDQLHALKDQVGPVQQERVQVLIEQKSGIRKPPPEQTGLELEKDVEAAVIEHLEARGFDVVKLSQYGKPKGMTTGTPDLYARHPARRLRAWIEVKKPGGRVRPDQKRWHATERKAGGEVWVVWSVRDLAEFLDAKGVA